MGAVTVGLVLQLWLSDLVPPWARITLGIALAPVIGLAFGVAVDLALKAIRIGKSS